MNLYREDLCRASWIGLLSLIFRTSESWRCASQERESRAGSPCFICDQLQTSCLYWNWLLLEAREQMLRGSFVRRSRSMTRSWPFCLITNWPSLLPRRPGVRYHLLSDSDAKVHDGNIANIESFILAQSVTRLSRSKSRGRSFLLVSNWNVILTSLE